MVGLAHTTALFLLSILAYHAAQRRELCIRNSNNLHFTKDFFALSQLMYHLAPRAHESGCEF